MAQEIVTWCDPCMERNEARTPGTTYTLQIGPNPPRDVDLCDEDKKIFLSPITELLDRLGSPVTPSARSTSQIGLRRPRGPRIMTCLLCPSAFGSDSALRSHYAAQHHLTAAGARIGTECPVCGEDLHRQRHLLTHVAEAHPEEVSLHMALHKRLDNPKLDTHQVASRVIARLHDS